MELPAAFSVKPAPAAAAATPASVPPINRGHMVARPWSAHPLRNIARGALRSVLQRVLRKSSAPLAPHAWQRAAQKRRVALLLLALLPAVLGAYAFAQALPERGNVWVQALQVSLFGVLSAWIAAGFWTALMGAYVLARGRDRYGLSVDSVRNMPLSKDARTAIIMPICNEHVPTVFAGLRATCESLAATGAAKLFDVFILSDSSDPDLRTAELAAWDELRNALGGEGRVFYRWRQHRTRRKAGNVADFCRRWGKNYRYMVVLDADSVMSGDCLVSMVRLMEAQPDAGIVQTAPRAVGGETLHARLQQFAARVTGPLFTAGMRYWQLGESHYWGHNAIIRVQPFMQHCALAKLPGKGALSGEIMSHDFIEAALMRRAGYHVWVVPELTGSYEQVPPNLIAELQRDRRWCHGNLQNFKLITEPGLHAVHRGMLLTGALAYVSAPLWLLFSVLSTVSVMQHGLGAVTQQPLLLGLLLLAAVMLLLPKLIALSIVFVRKEQHRYGGGLRLIGGAVAELGLSALYAPIRMLFHTQFVLSAWLGVRSGWKSPPRETDVTPWPVALRRHGPHSLLALLWVGSAVFLGDLAAWWLAPLLLGLLLAVPLSVLGSGARFGTWLQRRGVFLTPEETWAPAVVRHAQRGLQRVRRLPSFETAVFERRTNVLVRGAAGKRFATTGLKAQAGMRRIRLAVREFVGVDEQAEQIALSRADRMRLLSDPHALGVMHQWVRGTAEAAAR